MPVSIGPRVRAGARRNGASAAVRITGLFALLLLACAHVAQAQADLQSLLRQRAQDSLAEAPGALASATISFYEQLGFAPAWIDHPDRLDQLRKVLADLRADGLTPEHYGLALIDEPARTLAADEQAALDWRLTQGFLLGMIHVYRGKLDPHELDAVWNVERRTVDIDAASVAAAQALQSGRIEDFARQARPQHPVYRRLQDALQGLRAVEAQGGWPRVGPGRTIEPGAEDPRVPILRQRLVLGGYLAPAEAPSAPASVYDPALEAAARAFQQAQYLEVDGRVGKQTVAALDVPISTRIDQVRANLERSRWLLHELAGDFVLVDIAGYRLHYFHDGAPTFSTRVQVGKPLRRTPIFRAQVTHLTLNPSWIVPPTIFEEDALPEIRRSLRYLSKNHLRVIGANGREIDPRRVNWRHPPPGLLLRQDAGPEGALGRIAIRFPNPYKIYLHETPHQHLFSASQRAFSSGCIRVEAPLELAMLLLGADSGWTRETLDAAIETAQTQEVYLPRAIPILLMYWTVDLPVDGVLAFKPDVYGLDAAMLDAIDRVPEWP